MVDLFAITYPEVKKGTLALSDGVLEIDEVVRVVAHKRIVCRGRWGGLAVYAKIFIGKEANRYALRDETGVIALRQAGINTTDLLIATETLDGAHVLVYAAIKNAQNAEVVCKQLGKNARFRLMQKLVSTVAQHHQAGLIQTDLYLKNFLVQYDSAQYDAAQNALVYTLDGDGIRPLFKLFQSRQKLHNLATLFSKMDVLDDVWIEDLYQVYCNETGIAFSVLDGAKVWNLTQKIRQHVSSAYADKKVFRNCTDVKVTQNFRHYLAIASGFLVEERQLLSLDPLLEDPLHNIKNGHTCTIAMAHMANWQVVIKRYNIKNRWHGLSRAVRPSRAAISWANAHRLIISNIMTPKPLALVEARFGALRQRAYFVSEYIDAPDVAQFFAQTHAMEIKKNVADEVALMFYRLSLLKISHGDCKASNIKIKDSKPVLLDLDAMQADASLFERKHIKDLKRFMRNWANDAETTAMLKQAFVMAYDEAGDPWSLPLLVRAGIA